MRVLIVPNTGYPAAVEAARSLAAALPGGGHVPAFSHADAQACGLPELAAGADLGGPELVVALGGDGTILKAFHAVPSHETPVLGVNLGNLGFLCGSDGADIIGDVERAIRGEGRIERRATLEATLVAGGRSAGAQPALNEVFVGRATGARAVALAVAVDGEPLMRTVCDGCIVATPTGSTAYALSAGGPLVAPELRCLSVVPVSPHTLASRPIVLGPGSIVTLTLPDPRRAEACLVVDGDLVPCRQNLEKVEVRLADADVALVRLDGAGFMAGVRDTFLEGPAT